MELKDIKNLLDKLRAIFPRVIVGEDTPTVWYEILRDYTVEQGLEAVKTYLSQPTDKTPTVGMIKALMVEDKKPTFLTKVDHENYCREHAVKTNQVLTETGWCPMEDSVFINGKFQKKIEFCMDVLSPETVTAFLKDSNNYKDCLSVMTNMALEDVGIIPHTMNEIISKKKEEISECFNQY